MTRAKRGRGKRKENGWGGHQETRAESKWGAGWTGWYGSVVRGESDEFSSLSCGRWKESRGREKSAKTKKVLRASGGASVKTVARI